MFDYLWRRRPERPTEADLSNMSLPAVVCLLRELTKIPLEDFAKRLYITPPQLH